VAEVDSALMSMRMGVDLDEIDVDVDEIGALADVRSR